MAEMPFHVSIKNVKSMYREKNLRPYASAYEPTVPSGIDHMDEPYNLPDELCNED